MDEMFENWAETKSALLEGLDASKQKIVAPLLENQKNHLLSEAAAAGATGAHDIAGFRKILIPMIRRIIPGTIASELVGVQPMTGPVGLVYSLRYKYNTENTVVDTIGVAAGDDQSVLSDAEAFGNDVPLRAFYSGGAGAAGEDDQDAGAGGIVQLDSAGADTNAGDVGFAVTTGEAWGSSLDFNGGDGNIVRGGSGGNIEGSGGRKMGLEIVSQAVEAGSRKLQAGWTIEAMQDMNSQHGLDIESEMTQALSAEIVQEIDAEIINDLLALAGTIEAFDGAGSGVYGGAAGGNYSPAYVGDRLANLGVIINRVANEIGRKTRRGVGNFIVVSPMIVSVLQSAAKSVFAPAVEGSFKGPNNTMLVGTLNGSIKVYSYLWNQYGAGDNVVTSANATDDVILVGYKGGNGETDTGYFYCPYIPLMSSGVVVNPVTFQPVVSLMTRYGKTSFTSAATSLGNSADYYGKITVNNLDLL